MEKGNARLAKVIFITILIIIIVLFYFIFLYLSFRRVGEVLLILSTLPFALMGGIWLMPVVYFQWKK